LVAVTAVLSHHVQLSAAQWLAILGTMWAGMLPLALLGLAIGYLAADEIAFPLTMALYFALGALGGLWIPLSRMPLAILQVRQGRALRGGRRGGGGNRGGPGLGTGGVLGTSGLAAGRRAGRPPGLPPRHRVSQLKPTRRQS